MPVIAKKKVRLPPCVNRFVLTGTARRSVCLMGYTSSFRCSTCAETYLEHELVVFSPVELKIGPHSLK